MKKLILTLLFFGFLSYFSTAQRIGAGLAYGSDVSVAGLGINGEFFLKDKVAVSPGFIFYFEDAWEANGNVNWMLSGNDAILPYAITGLNIISSNGNSELGINAGIGSNFDIGGRSRPFAEVKYVLGDADQLVLLGGIKFPININ